MTWKNSYQLSKIYAEPEFQKDFSNLFVLKIFYENSIIKSDYKPPNEFESAISLTSIGNELATKIHTEFNSISKAEINYALFLKFFHQSLLIDVKNTNPHIIRNILDSEILNGNIKFPWNYEMVLYNRFFEMFEIETRKLSYEQTNKLLDGTPEGIFQIRDIIVGPFGVLTSSSFRYHPPLLNAPLWHCSDFSCQALHPTSLSSGKSGFNQILDYINDYFTMIEGNESEWNGYFHDFSGRPDYYDDMHLINFPWLLINCFSEKEVRNILSRLIEKHSKKIRQLFPNNKRFKKFFSGNNISLNLNKPQAIQIILLMPDELIIECIESLIDEEIIIIPPTEIRYPVISYKSVGQFGPVCRISRLGLQSFPIDKNIAILRLKRLVKSLYVEKNELKDLEYKLRFIKGRKLDDKLDKYLYSENPESIIRDIVLASPSNLEKAFRLMRYGNFCFPSTKEEENHLIDKILWKLGFDISLYPPYQTLFWDRLKKFLETARNHPANTESDREIIRSAGVNFFVSLEEILNLSLSFMTWALFSDHYGVTNFKCNFSEAQRFMASLLNEKSKSSSNPLTFDMSGKNTLYPLIKGFSLVAELCEESSNSECDLRRSKHEFPSFYERTELQLFPFVHKELILDLCQYDRNRLIEFLREITLELDKINISKIRNPLIIKGMTFLVLRKSNVRINL